MIHGVDSRFFIADDGRIIFRAGRTAVVIPEPDLALVRRRNAQAIVVGVVSVLASLVGWPQAYWRVWWIAIGFGVAVAAKLAVSRWVRERYGSSGDPIVAEEIRAAQLRQTNPESLGMSIVSGGLAVVMLVSAILSGRPRGFSAVLLVLYVAQGFGATRRLRQMEQTDQEPYPNITR
jgi:hypothetical protein